MAGVAATRQAGRRCRGLREREDRRWYMATVSLGTDLDIVLAEGVVRARRLAWRMLAAVCLIETLLRRNHIGSSVRCRGGTKQQQGRNHLHGRWDIHRHGSITQAMPSDHITYNLYREDSEGGVDEAEEAGLQLHTWGQDKLRVASMMAAWPHFRDVFSCCFPVIGLQ